MKQNRADRLLLALSVGGFGLLAVSFCLMPAQGLGVVPGILFWAGLLMGVSLQLVLEGRRKALFAKYKVKRKTMQKARNGLLSIGSNPAATVADCFLLASAVATVLVFVFTKGTGYWCYVCLTALVFSFCMHCILNGRIYVFVKNRGKLQQMLEQKANLKEEGEGKK